MDRLILSCTVHTCPNIFLVYMLYIILIVKIVKTPSFNFHFMQITGLNRMIVFAYELGVHPNTLADWYYGKS